jgi:hypothetical protein
MARPTSFRLPEELLARLEAESTAAGVSTTSLVISILDEGLKTRGFPGVVYRDGPTGRRAGLAGGPDIWEIVRDISRAPGRGSERIDIVAEETGLAPARIRLAADFYGAHPEEIDRRIEADVQAAERVRRLIADRERLLSR